MRLDSVSPDAIRAESRPIDYDFLPLLADSILDLGILSPIGIGPDMTLYYGAHRLAAAKEIGLERVPVVVLDTVQDRLDYLKVERDENAVRRTIKVTEQAELYREILELEKAAAKSRMSEGGKGEKISHPSTEGDRETRVTVTSKPVRAKEEAARAATGSAGRSKTLDKALEVMDKASDESLPAPVREVAEAALKSMNETGNVHGAFRAVKEAEESVIEVTPEAVAISEALKNDPELQDRSYMLNFSKAIARADDLFIMDAARIGRLADNDDLNSMRQFVEQATKFYNDMLAARPGLRLVGGN